MAWFIADVSGEVVGFAYVDNRSFMVTIRVFSCWCASVFSGCSCVWSGSVLFTGSG